MPKLEKNNADAEKRLGPNSKSVQDLKQQLTQEQGQSSETRRTKRIIIGFHSRVSRRPGDDEAQRSS